jgi:hypothetical protein
MCSRPASVAALRTKMSSRPVNVGALAGSVAALLSSVAALPGSVAALPAAVLKLLGRKKSNGGIESQYLLIRELISCVDMARIDVFCGPWHNWGESFRNISQTMAGKSLNKNLHAAKASKKDEFYTQLDDIERELRHYKDHFKGKVVLCNCDDPRISNFFHYFAHNFTELGLKKLITTCYKNQDRDLFSRNDSERAIWLEYNGDKNDNRVPDPEEIGIHELRGDGDFRSDECIELLKQADIVVTNPPFSLFREYVQQLVSYAKSFLIIGQMNALHYKEIFKIIKENKVWLGYSQPVAFMVPDNYEMRELRSWRDAEGNNWRSLGNAYWFTNLDIAKRHEDLVLYKTYNDEEYAKYDNYEAIEVSKVANIPMDYDGFMGVPDAFLAKYNPDQFELIGIPFGDLGKQIGVTRNHRGRTDIAITKDGKSRCPYSRIIIRRKK